MIIKERTPGLGRGIAVSNHVLCNSGLGYLDTKHFQFTMDPGGTPANIVLRHRSDQLADLGIKSWAPTAPSARFPGPVQPKSLAVPSDQGVWLEDGQRPKASWP